MRILYSHRTKSDDGQRIHIDGLTDALSALGHEVLIVGPGGESEPGTAPRPLTSTHVTQVLPGPLYEAAEIAYAVIGEARLRRVAKRFQPDVLYERYNLYYPAGGRVARTYGCPFLLEVNAPLVAERRATDALHFPPLAARSERRIWQSADAVLPVTSVLGRMIADQGVAEDRIHPIGNGVRPEFLEPQDGADWRARLGLQQSVVLGFTGFVREWHRMDRVLSFMSSPDGAGTALLLVGDGPALPSLRQLAVDLGLEDRVHLIGAKPWTEIPALLAAMDIALQPAVTPYASPLKLQEYMAQGLSVLAPDQPNIREVADEEVAVLIPPDDETAFHLALASLIRDKDRRHRLGTAARKRIVDRDLTWTGNAKRVIALAETMLSGDCH